MDLLSLSEKRCFNNKASSANSTMIRFYQGVLYMGDRLFLETAPKMMKGLTYYKNQVGHSVLIPIDTNLRNDLNTIETFVRKEVVLPKELVPTWPSSSHETYYKPLFNGDKMCIMLGKFCKFTLFPETFGVPCTVDDPPKLQEGEYRFRIEVVHVYMGPHQHNKLFSIDLRLVGVDCTPLSVLDLQIIDSYDEEKENSYKPSGGFVYKPLLKRQNAIAPH